MDLLLRQGVDRALTFDRDVAAPLCNDLLVDFLAVRGFVTDPRLGEAMRTHRRDAFLPNADLRDVYSDRAVTLLDDPDGWMLTSGSAPSVVAAMIEALDLPADRPCRVLEIGTGSGYSAALLAGSREGVEVFTVEILEEVREQARSHLAAAGIDRVRVHSHEDDVFAHGPFDRIVATCAFESIPPAWFEGLAEGGLVVVPVDSFVYRLRKEGERLVGAPLMTAEFVVCRDEDGTSVVEPHTGSGDGGTFVWWGDETPRSRVLAGLRPEMRVELPTTTPGRIAAARLRLEAEALGRGFTFAGPLDWGFGVTAPEADAACVCRVGGSFGFRHYPDASGEVAVELHGEARAVQRLWEQVRPFLDAAGPTVADVRVEVSPADAGDPIGAVRPRGAHVWRYSAVPRTVA